MANPVLLWFVGYSNITSIIIVTFCFLAMTIFIGFISMNADYQGQPIARLGVKQRNMVKLSNPFFLHLEEQSKKLTDGLHLRLSSLLPSMIFVVWGAKINPFHDLILKPGKWLQKIFLYNRVDDLRELDVLHCDRVHFSESGDHFISLQCPECVSSETLGDMPRKRYPVAVFTFVPEHSSGAGNTSDEVSREVENNGISRESQTEPEGESDNSIIGLISVIHLQDEKIKQNSHIISQYAKTSGIPLYSLQPLYLSGDQCQDQHENREKRSALNQKNNHEKLESTNSNNRLESPTIALNTPGNVTLVDHSPDDSSINGGEHADLHENYSNGRNTVDKDEVASSKAQPSTFGESVRKIRLNYKSGSNEKCIREEQGKERRNFEYGTDLILGSSFNVADVCDDGDDDDGHEGQVKVHAECVVCQTHRVKCVLLPCRHACICLGCLKLLFRCPMCRAGIESYFLLQNHPNAAGESTDDEGKKDEDRVLQDLQHQAVNASFGQMWNRLNERLNDFFGFR